LRFLWRKSKRRRMRMSRVSEEEIAWSYEVLTQLRDALNRVAANPSIAGMFMKEFFEKLPDILDAFMNLVKDEHVGVVRDVISAAIRAYKKVRVG